MELNKKHIGNLVHSKTMNKVIVVSEENKEILIKDKLTHLFHDNTKSKPAKSVRNNSKGVKGRGKS